jgi:hypothetical protein
MERIRRFPSPLIRRQLVRAGIESSLLRVEELERLEAVTPHELSFEPLDDPVGYLRLADAPSPLRLGICDRQAETIVLSWTADDLRRAAASGARAMRAAGILPRMKIANTLDGGFETPGSLILGDAVEALGGLDIPLGPVRDDRSALAAAELLARVGVDVLVASPPTAGPLLSAIERGGARSLAGILWLGPDPPRLNLGCWWRRWIAVPEVAIFTAIECERGRLHLDPSLRGEVENGRVVLTPLVGDAPVLRYDSGLRAGVDASACGCGESGMSLVLRS